MKRLIYISIVLFLVGIICLSFGYLVLSTVGADIETVDSKVQRLSLVLDSNDKPNIAYGTTDRGLQFAVRINREWTIETVSSVGSFPSLALDPDGNPHISFILLDEWILKYAFKEEGSWRIETIDTHVYGAFLALDSNKRPHVAYEFQYGDETTIRHAYRSEEGWVAEVVATLEGESRSVVCSISFDSEGEPHIVYGDPISKVVGYAFKSGGSWNNEIVDNETLWTLGIGRFVSLALDASNNPHICYHYSLGLTYAVRTDGAWNIETVDNENTGIACSLAIDSNGNLHISYYSNDNFLAYASKKDGEWTIRTIGSKSPDTLSTSLALDSEDTPHIVYTYYLSPYDPANTELEYFVGSEVSSFMGLPASPIVAYAFFGGGAVTIIVGAVLILRGRKTRVG